MIPTMRFSCCALRLRARRQGGLELIGAGSHGIDGGSVLHAQELYAAVNIVRRCPPSMVVHQLLSTPTIEHLGDLYFKFIDKEK